MSTADIVEIKHIMLPPNPRDFKDIYVVFELMETDLHQVSDCIGAKRLFTSNHHEAGWVGVFLGTPPHFSLPR